MNAVLATIAERLFLSWAFIHDDDSGLYRGRLFSRTKRSTMIGARSTDPSASSARKLHNALATDGIPATVMAKLKVDPTVKCRIPCIPSFSSCCLSSFPGASVASSHTVGPIIKPKKWLTKKNTASLVPARRNLFSEGGVTLHNRKGYRFTTTS